MIIPAAIIKRCRRIGFIPTCTRPMPEGTPCDPCLLLLLVVLLVQEVLKLLGCEQILGAALLPSPLPLY